MVARALLLICILLLPSTLLAKVSASVNRTLLYPGDVVTLTIEAENSDDEPDFSVLDQTFRTGGTSQSRQISIVNGRRADRTTWQIEIAPIANKDIIIPSIQVGSEATQPILLTIREPSTEEQAKMAKDIFVETSVENSSIPSFVQQQIRFSVRLFFRLPLIDGELSSPAVENSIIEQLGDDLRYSATRNGLEYQVIERHYAIFPEKSGELTIPPLYFQGHARVRSNQQQRPRTARERLFQDDFFNQQRFAQSSRPIRVQSRAITLQIKPQPDQYSGQHWLPSEQLSLKDSWAESPPEFRAGQPVSRTITVEAKGLAASHLPQLTLNAPDHLRIYPEPAETKSATDGSWVYGQSEQSFNYIPSRPGRQTLPAIEMTWWNITTRRQETTTLPAWQIDVLPPLESDLSQSLPEAKPAPAEITPEREAKRTLPESNFNGRLLLITLLVIILLLIGRNLYQKKRIGTLKWPISRREKSESNTLNQLKQACDNSNPTAAKESLLQLAAETWPQQPPAGLSELAQRLEDGVALLQALDRALYAAESSGWSGVSLWQSFQHGLPIKKPSSPIRDDALEELYPHY